MSCGDRHLRAERLAFLRRVVDRTVMCGGASARAGLNATFVFPMACGGRDTAA